MQVPDVLIPPPPPNEFLNGTSWAAASASTQRGAPSSWSRQAITYEKADRKQCQISELTPLFHFYIQCNTVVLRYFFSLVQWWEHLILKYYAMSQLAKFYLYIYSRRSHFKLLHYRIIRQTSILSLINTRKIARALRRKT
jgi:hypothetical protein